MNTLTETRSAGPRRAVPESSGQRKRSAAAGFFSGLTTVLVVALAGLALAVSVVPRLIGGVPLTVLTGSMEPALRPGDIVVVVPQEVYRVGDVVTFQPEAGDPTLITHRIIAVTNSGYGATFTTQGDANGAPDDPIVPAQIMGRVAYRVPFVGHAVTFVQNDPVLIGGAVAAILLTYFLTRGVLRRRIPKHVPEPEASDD